MLLNIIKLDTSVKLEVREETKVVWSKDFPLDIFNSSEGGEELTLIIETLESKREIKVY